MINRTYKQEEIKDFIKEALVDFDFIIESKYITKSEFTKFNKFFKNLLRQSKKKKNEHFYRLHEESETNQKFVWTYPIFHTYEDTKCEGRYIPLTTKNVSDLNMKEIYEEFPLLTENHKLLISLKANVKAGRRPKDLEKDYEAERLRKAQEEDKATCGICHNYWELVDMGGEGRKFNLSKNVIADHGFTIRDGFGRNGVCFGARFESWEKSSKVKIEYVKQVLKPTLDKVSKEKPSEATVTALTKWIARFKVELEDYYKLPHDVRYDTKEPESPEYLLTGQRVGLLISTVKPITLNELVQYWNSYKLSLQEEINRFELQIKNWTLQPTPREQLTIKGDK